jgi:hypothetical protein
MKLIGAKKVTPETGSDIETLFLSQAQFDYLGRAAREMNPDMPMAFAGAHLIRTLLERLEDSGINLAGASSVEELTQIAARGMRQRARE